MVKFWNGSTPVPWIIIAIVIGLTLVVWFLMHRNWAEYLIQGENVLGPGRRANAVPIKANGENFIVFLYNFFIIY